MGMLAACTSAAFAQTRVRVTHDQSSIWKPGFSSEAAVVPAGTILTVVGKRDEWYEVVVPDEYPAAKTTGFVFKSNVEVLNQNWVPFTQASPATQPPSSEPYAFGPEPPARNPRTVGVFAFGQAAYSRFAARNSFEAVLDHSGGASFGGGAEVRLWRKIFVNGAVDYFNKRGHRVFVIDGDVIRLGTTETITVMPVTVSAGWRFDHERFSPYVGAGAGRTFYKEVSRAADADENVDSRFTSYHALAGLEIRNDIVATAFEVVYSQVPNALGHGGASAAFGETNLGGVAGRVKVIFGR